MGKEDSVFYGAAIQGAIDRAERADLDSVQSEKV